MGMKLLVNAGRGFRVDLEGIRGVGLLVILFSHLIEWPKGGFVALDLFFVLSGYLITGLIIREHQRTGTIDLFAFYRRRTRRLAPAATVVVVVTVLVGFLVFPLVRAVSILWDGVWAMLLVANWNFALNNTDYFATWLPQSPLLHYWSLAVEEQFYLLWPALILAGVWLVHRRARRRPALRYAGVIGVIIAVTVVSLAWSVFQSATHPQVAYLSTLTRAWELGAGALLFFGNRLWERIPAVVRPILSWSGLIVILGASVVLTPQDPYPGYLALIPVIATAAIITSGVGGESHLLIATNPVMRYLGQISYSAYLWHWPIFVFLAALVGKQSPLYLWAAIPLSLVVAAAAFHLIEDPIRRSSWLEPRTSRHRHHRSSERARRRRTIGVRVAAVAALVAAVALVGVALVVQRTDPPIAAPNASASPTPTAPAVPGGADAVSTVETAVTAALDARSWPGPVVDQINSGAASPQSLLGSSCLDVTADTEDECVIGGADLPRTAVLLGDSVALSWMPGLGPALNELGYRVRMLSHSQCPFVDVSVSGSFQAGNRRAGYPEECDAHREWARDRTLALHPDLVIAADGEAEMNALILADGQTAREAWNKGVTASVQALKGLPVVMLTSPPQGPSLSDCYTNIATVKSCTGRIRDTWRDQLAAAQTAQKSGTAFTLIDTRLWFCSQDGWCPPFASDTVIRADEQHLAAPYAARLQAALVESLRPATGAGAPPGG